MRVLIVGHGRMGALHRQTVTNQGDQAITLDPHAQADHATWATVPKVDAAIVATPAPFLRAETLEALDRGIRTLVEKPAATTLADMLELQAADPTLAVGYTERANPTVHGFKALRTKPSRLTFTRTGPRRSKTDDVTLDLASHDIDLSHWLHINGDQDPTIHAAYHPHKQRTIHSACGLQADLLTRTLRLPTGHTITYPHHHDLLTIQYHSWMNGTPLATIGDAVKVMGGG